MPQRQCINSSLSAPWGERAGVRWGRRVEEFLDIISTGWGWLSSMRGVAASVAGIALSGLLIAVIADKPSYDLITGWMAERRRALYRGWLEGAENGLRRFFGQNLLGWRAFDRCLLLALVYPIFLLLLAWLFGAAPSLGGEPLFDAGLAWPQRAMVVVAAVVTGFSVWWTLRLHVAIAARLRRALPKRFQQHPFADFVSKVFVICAVLAGAVAVVVAVGVAIVGAGAVVVGGAVAVVGAGVGAVAVTAIMVVLYVLLPLANAALDWLSWAVSRRLLLHLIGRGADAGVGTILWHAAADLIAAVGLLIGLAVLLPFMVQVINMVSVLTGLPPIEWWEYLAAAQRVPFGEGLFVTGMLLSTLLPTAGHFLALMFALLFARPVWLRQHWLGWLTTPNPALIQRIAVIGWFAVSAALSWVLLFWFALLIYAGLSAFGDNFGTGLAELALWAGGRIGPALPPGAGAP